MLDRLDSLVLNNIGDYLSTRDAKQLRLCCRHVYCRVRTDKVQFGHLPREPVLCDGRHFLYRKSTVVGNVSPSIVAAWSMALDRTVLKLVWTTKLSLRTDFYLKKSDLVRQLPVCDLYCIQVRWMMRDTSRTPMNYRSQIKYTTTIQHKSRTLATSYTTTASIARKYAWCYARLKPCKGLLGLDELDDVTKISVFFNASEDNRWKGNFAWYFTEIVVSPYHLAPRELGCFSISDEQELEKPSARLGRGLTLDKLAVMFSQRKSQSFAGSQNESPSFNKGELASAVFRQIMGSLIAFALALCTFVVVGYAPAFKELIISNGQHLIISFVGVVVVYMYAAGFV